jgi:RNA-directed DNA polymerase
MQAASLANETKGQTDWNAVDWRRAERNVRNLRQRIFRASREGDHRKVRSLQKLMLRSRSNTLTSVRRVTQLNAGKNTPGVDKLVVKTPAARGKLVDEILAHQTWRVAPVRRVYIPKANGKQRPLGIPTIIDRAAQNIVKNALEPEWEAQFEACSYGFRPGRGCHDAIAQIFNVANVKNKRRWVLDADIQGAFDNIGHGKLLDAIATFPARELVKQWLKAGYMENGTWRATESGTPQGGVISPLLANIAFHGMETALGILPNRQSRKSARRSLVRYADDFVVFCETKEDAEAARQDIETWLAPRGLKLSEEKTRIVHLSEGFDFLGFNVRHYPTPTTSRSGWKLLITPSKNAVAKFRERLRNEWHELQGHNVRRVLAKLNPILRGWANYYRTVVSKATFNELDTWLFTRTVRYVRFSHPNKPWKWCKARYWGPYKPGSNNQWVFGDRQTGAYLLRLNWFPIQRHILVRGNASPDDPALREYWIARQERKIHDLPPKWIGLARTQHGLCPHCKTSLLNGEELHMHHIRRRGEGGTNQPANLRLVHLYCHQQIHGPEDARPEAKQFA